MNTTMLRALFLNFVLVLISSCAVAQSQFRETIWFQSNRDFYLEGEKVKFKTELLELDTYRYSELSKSIRVELIDSEGNIIIQKNLLLSDSKRSGTITLPSGIDSGWYYIRSYTNWMRNFDEKGFTIYPIRVVNYKDLYSDSILKEPGKVSVVIFTNSVYKSNSKRPCSIYATNEFNEAIAVAGTLINIDSDTIASFNTDYTGWGILESTPKSIEDIQVLVDGFSKEDIDIKFEHKSSQQDLLQISIDQRYGYVNVELTNVDNSNNYKLLVHKAYSWFWYHSLKPRKGKILFRVPIKDIPSGISQITLLNNENKVIFSKLWSDYDSKSSNIDIKLISNELKPNNSYEIEYLTSGYLNNNGPKQLYQLSDKYISSSRIHHYLPGLPGWVSNMEIPSGQEAFDGWLLANAYPDSIASAFFISDPNYPSTGNTDITEDQPFKYLTETRGGILSGRIIDSKNMNGVKNIDLGLTILNNNSFYSSKTDDNGYFIFSFPDQFGIKDFVLNYIEISEPGWKVQFTSEFHDVNIPFYDRPIRFSKEEISFLKSQSLDLQLLNVYYPQSDPHVIDSVYGRNEDTPFYGDPDFSIRINDYIDLPSIREVIFEVIPSLTVKEYNNISKLQVNGPNLSKEGPPPLILFDGIPISEVQPLLELNPKIIKSIDLKTEYYIYGYSIYGGIISFNSINKDFGGMRLPGSALLSSVNLPEKLSVIKEVSIDNEVGYPSIDNILEWDYIKYDPYIDKSLRTNDNLGTHYLSIFGYDNDGLWHYGRLLFYCNY